MFRLEKQYYINLEDISEIQTFCRGGRSSILTGKLSISNKKVALKTSYDNEGLSREAYTMSIFQTKYFVKLLGLVPPITRNDIMVVMDLYETDLAEIIRKNFSFIKLEQKLEWLRDIFRGTDEMHKKGYVHRDLKAKNIFLDSHGRIKIGDFGLSCLVSEMKKEVRESTPSGTPTYMAPEVFHGKEKWSTAMDIYSLGGVIFHVATGKEPYSGQSEPNILLRKDQNNLEPIPNDCHTLFKESITACWSYEPAKRPTAAWLADRFAGALVKIKEKLFFKNQYSSTLFTQNKQESKSNISNSSDQTLELKEAWINFSKAWDNFDEIWSKKSLYSYDKWKEKIVGTILERKKQGEVDQELIQKIDECTSMVKSIKNKAPEEDICIKNFLSALTTLKNVATMSILLEREFEMLTPGIR